MKGVFRIFLHTLEHASLLNFIAGMLMLGLIFLVDGLFLLMLSTRVGGFMALGGSALASLLGVVLVGSSFRRYSRSAVDKIRLGLYPREEFIHLSALFMSLVAVAIPGFFSFLLATLFYIPLLREVMGRALHWKFSREFQEVYNYRRMIED